MATAFQRAVRIRKHGPGLWWLELAVARKRPGFLRRVTTLWVALCGMCAILLSFQTPVSAQPSKWFVTPSPNYRGSGLNLLNDVSCSSLTDCMAVGWWRNVSSSKYVTFTESWNGSKWSVVPSPNPSGTKEALLGGISCATPSFCVAVGAAYETSHLQPLIETWNGAEWTVTPSPVLASLSTLSDVSCLPSTTTDCVAVGSSGGGTLIESWDGTSWSVVPSPNNDINSALFDVTCLDSTDCVAVGGSAAGTLVESWDGTTWSISPSPNPTPGTSVYFASVSCVSAIFCDAVGSYFPSQKSRQQTLVENWDGTSWTIQTSPDPNPKGDFLEGVSCTSQNSCVAAGATWNKDLIEAWDGTEWSVTKSSPKGSYLNSVDCETSISCVAVGFYSVTPTSPGLSLVLTGTALTVTPNAGAAGTFVTVSAGAFAPGERVAVTYKTGISDPTSTKVCPAVAAADGTFSCTGNIPASTDAGANGTHDILAVGKTTGIKVKSTFTLESP
jgi:hypothetical protein